MNDSTNLSEILQENIKKFETTRDGIKKKASMKKQKSEIVPDLETLEQLVKIIDENPLNEKKIEDLYYDFAVTAHSAKEYDKGLEYAYKSLEGRKIIAAHKADLIKDDPSQTDTLENTNVALSYCLIGILLGCKNGDETEITTCFENSVNYLKQLDDGRNKSYANASHYFGDYLLSKDRIERAIENLKIAIQVYELIGKSESSIFNSVNCLLQAYKKDTKYLEDLMSTYRYFLLLHTNVGLKKTIKAFREAFNEIQSYFDRIDQPLVSIELLKGIEKDFEEKEIEGDMKQKIRQALGYLFSHLGNIHSQLENHNEAKLYFEKAKNIFVEFNDQSSAIETLILLGSICKEIKQFEASRKFYEEVLELISEDDPNRNYISGVIHNNIGSLFFEQHKYKEAIAEFEKLIEFKKATGDEHTDSMITICTNLGVCYENEASYQKATEYLENALLIATNLNEPDDVKASIYDDLGHIYYVKGEYQKSTEYYQMAKTVFDEIYQINKSVLLDLATVYNRLGKSYVSEEDYSEAIKCFTYVKNDLLHKTDGKNKTKLEEELIESHSGLGLAYCNLGKPEEALKELTYALKKIREINPDSVNEATYLEQIGMVYNNQGEYAKAIEHYEKALEIRKKAENFHLIGYCLQCLANCQINDLRFDEAIENLKVCLGYYKSKLEPDHPDIGILYKILGTVYNNQGDFKTSEECLRKAHDIISKKVGPDCAEVALIQNILGQVFINRGEFKHAEANHLNALKILQKTYSSDHSEIGNTYIYLAQAYINLGSKQDAIKYLTDAEKIFSKLPKLLIKVYVNFGHCYKVGYPDKAIEYYKKAVDIHINDYKRTEEHSEVILIRNFIKILETMTIEKFDALKEKYPARDFSLDTQVEKPFTEFKFDLENVPDDDSCMFHCVAQALFQDQYRKFENQNQTQEWYQYVQGLRELAGEIICQNIEKFKIDELKNKNIDNYLEDLKKKSTWGGICELKAFALYFKVTFSVIDVLSNRAVQFPKDAGADNNSKGKVFLVLDKLKNKNAAHYHLLYAKDPVNVDELGNPKILTIFNDNEMIRHFAYFATSELISRNKV